MLIVVRLILAIILLSYPFVVYFGLLHFEFWQVALFVVVIALIRLYVIGNENSKLFKVGLLGAVLLMFFGLLALWLKQELWLKIYPIAISLSFCYAFTASLWTDKSMIQRFAEIREKNINTEKQIYMRKLTVIWCGFFVVNAMISSYTLLFSSTKQWMIYNGFISYFLMGLLFGGELLYRYTVVLKRNS